MGFSEAIAPYLLVSDEATVMMLAFFIIQTLKLRRRDKYGIASVFLIGVMTITFSTVRFSVLYKWIIAPQTSPTAVVQVQVWTTVELVTGQIASCLASFKKLLQRPAGIKQIGYIYTFNGNPRRSGNKISSGNDATQVGSQSQTELVTMTVHASEENTSV